VRWRGCYSLRLWLIRRKIFPLRVFVWSLCWFLCAAMLLGRLEIFTLLGVVGVCEAVEDCRALF